ncbi:hypothetical protein D7Z26_20780 [Cohnella endophytica]|uniref:histidine kinase n=1 Tax=Cohnella endophytica TaxID=2419778 RepID=A0A494XG36_9BACL|nr:ATP-binding protein [Cohnella endophytica]RKP48812.1 hypothetical protein D7Z26_20780 [Cohnella endophytica]
MWKDSMLQILIAFFPVFIFMVWYSRPEKTRYVPAFLTIVCGVAICLSFQFALVSNDAVIFDFRHVPFVVGTLYGGIPGAILLIIIYLAMCLNDLSQQADIILFAAFVMIYFPILFYRIRAYKTSGRAKKRRIVYFLCSLLALFQVAQFFDSGSDWSASELPVHIVASITFYLFFLLATTLCVYFVELGFERIQLQIQLYDVSNKYRGEVRRLQQFIDNTPLIVVFCDAEGRVTHINDMAQRLVSPLGNSDIINRYFSFFAKRMEMEAETNPVEHVLQDEDRYTEVVRARGRAYYTVTCPIKQLHLGGMDGVLFIGHDITEIQQLKDEVNRMDRLSLVGQMAASITHEIRNPMAVIRGFVQLLNERSPDDQQSYFRIVIDELDRANAIINDFLSLAQNRIVEKEASNLNELMNELLPLLWADANLRGQIIDMRLGEEMDLLHMNSKEMKQLVLNLARNGMEAMNDKGTLRLETLNMANTIQLRVTDNGVGIAPEKLEKLFEPFYTTKTNGTGLGLALCLSIVERHNGKIHVESEPGRGTSFIVSFCKPGRNCW